MANMLQRNGFLTHADIETDLENALPAA